MTYIIDFEPGLKTILSDIRDRLREHCANQREQIDMAKEVKAEQDRVFKSLSALQKSH
jgi:hypothetical protein